MGVIIGTAARPQPNERARQLTGMFMTLIGTWTGTYRFFDDPDNCYRDSPGALVFSATSMPNVMTLDAKTERPDGPPIHALTMMVVQADGASWRQMAFLEASGRLQDKLITDYQYSNDDDWSVDMLEVQQDLGLVSAAAVKFLVKNGHLEMRKHRKYEGGAAAARDYDSFASFDRAD